MEANVKYPLKEYEKVGEEPIFCELCGHSFVVPYSYHGDKDAFVKDLFNQDDEAKKWPKPIEESNYITIDGYKILPPYRKEWRILRKMRRSLTTTKIKNRMLDNAILFYDSAILWTRIHRAMLKRSTNITLNSGTLNEEIDEISKFICQKRIDKSKAINSSVINIYEPLSRKGINIGAKAITFLPIITAYLIGKKSESGKKLLKIAKILWRKVWLNQLIDEEKSKVQAQNINKFLDKVCSKIIRTTIPVITKFVKVSDKMLKSGFVEIKNTANEQKNVVALATATAAGVVGGVGAYKNQNPIQLSNTSAPKTEMVVAPKPNQTKFYTISDVNSLNEALKDTEPLIHRILLPTEFFCENGYPDDDGKDPNTIGVGLYFCPYKLDPTNPGEGIKVKEYFKNASKNDKITTTYSEAMDLTMWWGTVRGHSRIMKTMATQLKGCTLTQSQLAAVYSVYYNSEASGLELCQHIQKNPDENPIETAAFITTLQPKPSNGKFDRGIFKRHCHEALVYLNYDDYCNKILDFNIRSSYKINRSGAEAFFPETPVYVRTVEEYSGFINELNNGVLGNETDKLVNEMLSYNPAPTENSSVTSIKDFIENNTSGDTQIAMLERSTLPDYNDVAEHWKLTKAVNIMLYGVSAERA